MLLLSLLLVYLSLTSSPTLSLGLCSTAPFTLSFATVMPVPAEVMIVQNVFVNAVMAT
jgi:hypothetical protein